MSKKTTILRRTHIELYQSAEGTGKIKESGELISSGGNDGPVWLGKNGSRGELL